MFLEWLLVEGHYPRHQGYEEGRGDEQINLWYLGSWRKASNDEYISMFYLFYHFIYFIKTITENRAVQVNIKFRSRSLD